MPKKELADEVLFPWSYIVVSLELVLNWLEALGLILLLVSANTSNTLGHFGFIQ